MHTDELIVNDLESIDWSHTSETMTDLQTVLGVQYDSMYLFSEYTNTDIPYILGNSHSNNREIKDSEKRIILFHVGKIVY